MMKIFNTFWVFTRNHTAIPMKILLKRGLVIFFQDRLMPLTVTQSRRVVVVVAVVVVVFLTGISLKEILILRPVKRKGLKKIKC